MKSALLVLGAVLAVVACAAVQAPRLTPALSYSPVPRAADEAFRASPPAQTPLDPSPTFALSRERLPNGMELVLVERHGLPLFSARLVAARGSRDLAMPLRRAELLDLASEAVVRDHESSARANPELRPDVACDPDHCEALVSGVVRSFDAGLDVLADLAIRPQFPASQVDLVRRDFRTFADRMGGGAEAAVSNCERSLLFPPSDPYAPIGPQERASMAAVTMRDLADVYTQVFQPQHAALVVAGDLRMDVLRASAARAFGGWVQSRPALPWSAESPAFPGATVRTLLVDMRTTLVHAYVVARGPAPSEPTFDAMSLLAMELSTPKGQLFEELRSGLGATYDISASLAVGRVGAWWEIGGAFELDKAVPAVAALLAAVRSARDRGVNPADLEGARTRFIASHRAMAGTTSGVTSLLATTVERGLPFETALGRPARVAQLTPDHLRDAARRWLGEDALRLVVVGPRKWIEHQFEPFAIGTVEWRDQRGERAR